MGFAEYFDVKWMQEAEIKHGRVCMLAAVGMVSLLSCFRGLTLRWRTTMHHAELCAVRAVS